MVFASCVSTSMSGTASRFCKHTLTAGDPADLVGASEHQLLQQHGLSSQLLLGEDMFASDYSPDVSQDFGEPEGYGEGYDNYYSQSSDMIAVGNNALACTAPSIV